VLAPRQSRWQPPDKRDNERSYGNLMNSPRIIFAGTPDFAAASLTALFDAGHKPCAVLTQPDRPAGRGKQLTASPVKVLALEHGLKVLQPGSLHDDAAVADLAALNPDIVIVAAYGLILPQQVLDIPRAGCLNVHASMLPRWRGAAPIQAAILAGDETTGVCLMAMEAGLDTGPVYACEEIAVGEHTAGELHDRIAMAGGALLVKHLDAVITGELTANPQAETLATYARKIKTADAQLDWRLSATDLVRRVRAYNPVPGAWFMIGDERVKCWAAQRITGAGDSPGTVVAAGKSGIDVSCAEDMLRLESLQRPGKQAISAAEFSSQVDLTGRQL
jgi:methionyl-tRNA formyltransferase